MMRIQHVLDLLLAARHGNCEIEREVMRALGLEVVEHAAWWCHCACRAPGEKLSGLPGITRDAGRAIKWIERRFGKKSYYLYRTDKGDYVAQIGDGPRGQFIHPNDPALALCGALLKAQP